MVPESTADRAAERGHFDVVLKSARLEERELATGKLICPLQGISNSVRIMGHYLAPVGTPSPNSSAGYWQTRCIRQSDRATPGQVDTQRGCAMPGSILTLGLYDKPSRTWSFPRADCDTNTASAKQLAPELMSSIRTETSGGPGLFRAWLYAPGDKPSSGRKMPCVVGNFRSV